MFHGTSELQTVAPLVQTRSPILYLAMREDYKLLDLKVLYAWKQNEPKPLSGSWRAFPAGCFTGAAKALATRKAPASASASASAEKKGKKG